jgi:lysylphosphatidylglycerol synthetase-like protein (DUF2156 family)
MKLRNKISRARRAGVEVVEIRSEDAAHAEYYRQLSRVSEEWLADKGKKELDFMIGEVGSGRNPLRRTFVVVDREDRVQAFITYVPTWGDHPGYLHDLSRRRPGAPTGSMELCNVAAIERFQEEGVRYLHFGFTPFVIGGPEAPTASRAASWLIQWIRANGSFVYPTATQLDYKLKWGPDLVQPEYLAARPLSLGAILDLLLVTRSI